MFISKSILGGSLDPFRERLNIGSLSTHIHLREKEKQKQLVLNSCSEAAKLLQMHLNNFIHPIYSLFFS
jgi:hypothetical protein